MFKLGPGVEFLRTLSNFRKRKSILPTFVLINRICQFFCNLNFPKNFPGPFGKLRTEFTSPVAMSTSSGLSDTNFFAHCACACAKLFCCLSNLYYFFDVLTLLPKSHLKLPVNRESLNRASHLQQILRKD